MGHGLAAKTHAELVDKLVNRGFLTVGVEFTDKLKTVDRSRFLPPGTKNPYANEPVPIAKNHCMSTPQFHAQIISLLAPRLGPGRNALEIGCGSGFLPAVFKAFGCDVVVGTERDESLLDSARRNLAGCGVEVCETIPKNIVFDALYISPSVPSREDLDTLLSEIRLSEDAIVVAPIGDDLVVLDKCESGWEMTPLFKTQCEPMIM